MELFILMFFESNHSITISKRAIVSVVLPDLEIARNLEFFGSIEFNILETEFGSSESNI